MFKATTATQRHRTATDLEDRLVGASLPASPGRLPPLEPLKPQDLIWCRLPGAAPLPTGVLSFVGHVSHATAVAFLRDKLFLAPAFARQIALSPAGKTSWQPVTHIDVARHLQHRTLDCASDAPQLCEALAAWCQAPLRPGQLPWDMTLVDCLDRSLIFVRVHHAVSDGPGMMQALLSCHDDPAAWSRAEKLAHATMARRKQQILRCDAAAGLAMRSVILLLALIIQAIHGCAVAAKAMQAVWAIATRHADRRTLIKPTQPVKCLRFARVPGRWPLATIKDIAHAQGGGTVNDVLLAVFAGALREVLATSGGSAGGIKVRSMQTVNLPRGPGITGNNVGLAMADLPIDEPTPAGRYQRVHQTMLGFKRSLEPFVAAKAMALIARLPSVAVDVMQRRTTGQCSVFVSNVVGPTEPFVLDGHVAENMYWFAPRFGDIGVQFPVLSYNGSVQVTVQVDAALEVDAQALAVMVQKHFEYLADASGEREAVT